MLPQKLECALPEGKTCYVEARTCHSELKHMANSKDHLHTCCCYNLKSHVLLEVQMCIAISYGL
jgi:hypothetical protein